MRKQKPTLNFWQIWNMCFGFLGIQFGFALQNANVSRIFQSLGAAAFLGAVLWTVFSTREYSPAELAEFDERAS